MEIKIIDAEYVADRMVINYTEDGKARSLIIAPEEIIRYRNAARQGVRRIYTRSALNVSVNCILLRLAIMSAVTKPAGCTTNANR